MINIENVLLRGLLNKFRIDSEKGPLSISQLFEIKIEILDKLAVDTYNEAQSNTITSFLSNKNNPNNFKFQVLSTILQIRQGEKMEQSKQKQIKEHNDKIYALIQKQEEEKLSNLSVNELKKMLK